MAFRSFIAGNQQFQDTQPFLYQVMVTICYISIFLNINATFGSFLLLHDLGEVGYEAAKLSTTGRLEQLEVFGPDHGGINHSLKDFGSNRLWNLMVFHCKLVFANSKKNNWFDCQKNRDAHVLLRYCDLSHGTPGIYHADGVDRNHRPHDACRWLYFRTYEPFYAFWRIHEAETNISASESVKR